MLTSAALSGYLGYQGYRWPDLCLVTNEAAAWVTLNPCQGYLGDLQTWILDLVPTVIIVISGNKLVDLIVSLS